MTLHPLLALAQDRDVRHSSGFRRARQTSRARCWPPTSPTSAGTPRAGPTRASGSSSRTAAARPRSGSARRTTSTSPRRWSGLPRRRKAARASGRGRGRVRRLGRPAEAGAADAALGDADPNRGVERVDLLGIAGEDRLVLGFTKYLDTDATRAGTGDTPLRFLLDAPRARRDRRGKPGGARRRGEDRARARVLGCAADRSAPREPAILGALCRRREAQKGAAWVHEIERLAREIDQHIGVSVIFAGLGPRGRAGLELRRAGGASSLGPPRARLGAGRRPRAAEAEAAPEGGLSPSRRRRGRSLDRPVRRHGPHESYHPGDRIEHPTLGLGIVQKCFPGKVEVRFGEATSRLVAGRPL